MPLKPILFLILTLVNLGWQPAPPPIFTCSKGSISFTSDAPMELIQAKSMDMKGAFKSSDRTFAFRVAMNTFEGFNDPLQQEHFCEKFLECEQHPYAVFRGRLIEDYDFSQPGTYEVRAKGTLDIHGVERERIIPVQMKCSETGIEVEANFSVQLDDHDIRIPQVVYQKVAEEILVSISAQLQPTQSDDS